MLGDPARIPTTSIIVASDRSITERLLHLCYVLHFTASQVFTYFNLTLSFIKGKHGLLSQQQLRSSKNSSEFGVLILNRDKEDTNACFSPGGAWLVIIVQVTKSLNESQ